MKSFMFIILVAILFSQYECAAENECSGTGINKKDCNNRSLRASDFRCCYYYYKIAGREYKECVPISKVEYDDFNTFLKFYEKVRKAADAFSFDCTSNYIIVSMLWLVLLLF